MQNKNLQHALLLISGIKNEDILQANRNPGWYHGKGKEENRMKKEIRTVFYDDGLHMEAYRFEGVV